MSLEKAEVKIKDLVGSRTSGFGMKASLLFEKDILTARDLKKNRMIRFGLNNVGKVHMQKDKLIISAMNFEVYEDDKYDVVSGVIEIKIGKDHIKEWYDTLNLD